MTVQPSVEILAYAEERCWLIFCEFATTASRPAWDCYRAIAKALLTVPIHPEE